MNAPDPIEDSMLAQQARAGSSAAFGELVRRHHVRVFGFLLALTRHRQDAEDLTQETFLRAWDKFPRFDPALPLLPWLFTIARRQSIAAHRRRRPLPVDDVPPEPPAEPALWLWEMAKVHLAPDAYSALWLHYREEMPLKEVAAILGKREGAVKVILYRARHTLAQRVRGRDPHGDPDCLYQPQRTTP